MGLDPLLKGLLYCLPCGTGMVHTYTQKNEKRYRYYVCLNAQQRGWASCPTKSLTAHEIETAVVEHIRSLGRNPEMIAATAAKVKERSDQRRVELEVEQRAGERELKRLHGRLRQLVRASIAPAADGQVATDQLADLQDQIRALEQQLTSLREETIALQKETVDDGDLAQVLAAFDPVWESLSPREQAEIIKLLIERIGYDGKEGTVTVTFRSAGIKALCSGGASGHQRQTE